MIERFKTKTITLGGLKIGSEASSIPVQSMCFTDTRDVEKTVDQINRLTFAGCDIVRVAVPDKEAALALKEIKKQISIPLVADIHFNYRLALIASEVVDGIRINPGNIGKKSRMAEVVRACQVRDLPIRIGVNGGSLEKIFDQKYGVSAQGMVQSALYNIKFLEDLGFENIKVSLKTSDVFKTVEAYQMLRPLTSYPFHLGVTEAGTKFGSTIKSSVGLGALLMQGIGDTLRVSMTGELEEEIKVGKGILKSLGLLKEGINFISCPTCGRIEADLVKAIKIIESRLSHIKTPLNVSVMGCAVNAIGEGRHSDVAIAFSNGGKGLIMKDGEVLGKYKEEEIIDKFVNIVENKAAEVVNKS